MKKILLSLSLVTVALAGKAQNCSDLFISKYVSMGANNKCIEIYNPTNAAIVMTNVYYIARYKTPTSSGNVSGPIPAFPSFNDTVWIKGTIPAYGTWVLCNPEYTVTSSNAGAICDPALRAHANQLTNIYGTYGSTVGDPMYFKGSDALTLEKKVGGSAVIVDLFGRFTDYMASSTGKPSAWSTIAPYTGGTGMGTWITKGYMMVRKASVQTGVKTNPASFIALAEYDTIAKPVVKADTLAAWNKLGSHTCNCKPVGIHELTNNIVSSVYPNPTGDNSKVTISSSELIKSYTMFSVTGSVIKQEELVQPKNNFNITIDQLIKGVYFVQMKHTTGLTSIIRFIKN